MRTLYFFAIIFTILILPGCSLLGIENKRVDYKSTAIKMSTLEVPPDLTTPVTKDQHTIPGSVGEIATSFSDFVKGDQVAKVDVDANVLPKVKKVHLERNGNQRWLVVDNKVENIWPLVKEFWLEQGFVIKSEIPAAGLIETDWAEKHVKIKKNGLSKMLSKVFDTLHSSGEQNMYRTRLERSKDGGSSEIYISHRGMEEALDVDKNGYKWRPRPNDPELEASMLQLLMIKMGGDSENQDQKKSQVNLAHLSVGAATIPKLQEINGSNIIILNEPFDKSWRKVGLALDQAGINVQDKDRVSGIYYVKASNDIEKKNSLFNTLMFWRSDSNKNLPMNASEGARYKVTVREINSRSQISALNGNSGKDEATDRIISMLYKQLSK